MSTSKRKSIAGGYQDSSDDESERELQALMNIPLGQSGNKKARMDAHGSSHHSSLPRLSMNFQLSSPGGLSLVSSHGFLTARDRNLGLRSSQTPSTTTHEGISPSADYHAVIPNRSTTRVNGVPPQQPQVPNLAETTRVRATLALEKSVNELTSVVEEHKRVSHEQYQCVSDKLDRLVDAILRFVPPNNSGSSGSSVTPATSTGSATPSSNTIIRFELANPKPTPDLIEIASRVVSDARNRVGKKKGGADDNSFKEHARTAFYRMLCMTAAKSVKPYFEDEHGEPDTLPSQLTDPATGYCQPCPHWRVPLTKQVAWIPTYISRFGAMIPNDQSTLSVKLRELTDEQIVVLLNDGPFKSAQTAWRDLKKTPEEVTQMQTQARRNTRVERKASTRVGYIKTIPALQGPEWEYLTHAGYTSLDESDSEGTLVTKRPDHRAQWENNLFDGINIGENDRIRARLGPSYRPPPRRIEQVRRPVPQLERGTGANKVPVRIAVCGFSKSWRREHQEEFEKCGHLVNFNVNLKPDLSNFLAQFPVVQEDLVGDSTHSRVTLDTTPTGEVSNQGDQELNAEGEGGDEGDGGDSMENGVTFSGVIGGAQAANPVAPLSVNATGPTNDNFPIDPRVLAEDWLFVNHSGPGRATLANPNDVLPENAPELNLAPASPGSPVSQPVGNPYRDYHVVHSLQMPPPPLPGGSNLEAGAKAPRRSLRRNKGEVEDKTQQELANETQVDLPLKQKRGGPRKSSLKK